MAIGNIIGWIVFGLVAGAFARLLHPGRDPMNWLWTMLLGIGGALVGGWIGSQLGINTDQGLASWLAAISGAILLLAIYHFLTARSAATARPRRAAATSDDYKRAVFDDLPAGPAAEAGPRRWIARGRRDADPASVTSRVTDVTAERPAQHHHRPAGWSVRSSRAPSPGLGAKSPSGRLLTRSSSTFSLLATIGLPRASSGTVGNEANRYSTVFGIHTPGDTSSMDPFAILRSRIPSR